MNLNRAAMTVGGYTMISRIFGFLRDILVAAILGAGPVADAFFVAFKLPNFFRRLFAEGAFNAAFVPMFSGVLEEEGKNSAQIFAEQTLALMLPIVFVFVTLMQIGMPFVMNLLAPGFADQPDRFDLAVQLTRLTFPYLLFISLVSLMGGVLNSVGKFGAVAATPILLNLSLIGALLIGTNYTQTPAHALAWGVSIAGMLQLTWLVIALDKSNFSLGLRLPKLNSKLKRLLKLILPGALGAGVVQINLLTDVVIASLLPEGSISFLYFADRVNQLPVGVIGVAVGTALLPMLSREVAAGNENNAMAIQNRAIRISLMFAIPSSFAIAVIAFPIISVLFEHGAFDAGDTQATAFALIAYVLGLPAYVIIKILTPSYFARGNTSAPVRIAIICVLTNLLLNLTLVWWLQHVGLALATAIAAWINVWMLSAGLKRRGWLEPDAQLRQQILRIVLSAGVMLAALAAGKYWISPFIISEAGPIINLVFLILLGTIILVVFGYVIGAIKISDLTTMFRDRVS